MKLRSCLLLVTILVSGAINAAIENDLTMPSEGPEQASLVMSSGSCPADFFHLPLYPKARHCQVFDDELPASLTYHANTDQQGALAFYQQELGQADSESSLKGRTVLQYKSTAQTIVISDDGSGSQIDILIKSSD